jgi:putative flippase GtrA
MTWNFLWHRRVTFPAAAPGGLLARYASFCGACLLGAGMNFIASLALCASNPWFSERPALAAAVGALTGAAANFLLCKRWVFRQSTVAGVSGADAPTLAPAQPIATSRQAA